MQLKRVVVTGIGALTPIGNNAQDFWSALSKGVSGARICLDELISPHEKK